MLFLITEADTNVSLDVIDQWIDNTANGRANISPTDIPWDALQVLLSQTLFGGRVDHHFDQVYRITITEYYLIYLIVM